MEISPFRMPLQEKSGVEEGVKSGGSARDLFEINSSPKRL
jgi:hypothetical protein